MLAIISIMVIVMSNMCLTSHFLSLCFQDYWTL